MVDEYFAYWGSPFDYTWPKHSFERSITLSPVVLKANFIPSKEKFISAMKRDYCDWKAWRQWRRLEKDRSCRRIWIICWPHERQLGAMWADVTIFDFISTLRSMKPSTTIWFPSASTFHSCPPESSQYSPYTKQIFCEWCARWNLQRGCLKMLKFSHRSPNQFFPQTCFAKRLPFSLDKLQRTTFCVVEALLNCALCLWSITQRINTVSNVLLRTCGDATAYFSCDLKTNFQLLAHEYT